MNDEAGGAPSVPNEPPLRSMAPEIQKTVHVPIRLIHDEKKAKEARGDNDWAMMGSPQYVIDRIGDFLDVGVMEFTPQIRPQNPEVYQELDETVFSAFD